MLERYLVEHCAPTLASIKTANLFTYAYSSEEEVQEQIALWNASMNDKGIFVMELRRSEKAALIYVCRKSFLERDLKKPGVAQFMKRYGYTSLEPEDALKLLQSKLQVQEEFPHEIGIFLGYPLGDVIGFIKNAGHNCKCTGCWKVYCNECEAVRTFAKYKKCKDVYMRLWQQGRSVLKLTVAA